MFEYLMPQLIMPTYENTLLNQTYRAIVRRQIEYVEQRGVPWGISESGYNLTDVNMIYQYRAFGVPGLGFKRGLIEDLVIAPYASSSGLDDLFGRGMHESAANGWRGLSGAVWLIRGDRFYALASFSGRDQCNCAVLHGPPPGHELPLFSLCVIRPTYAKKIHGQSYLPGCGSASTRKGSQGCALLSPCCGGIGINLEGRHAGVEGVLTGLQ